MKIKFDPNQKYQLESVDAILNIFDGQPLNDTDFEVSISKSNTTLFQTELGIGNNLLLDEETILKNVNIIQEQNGIEKTKRLQGMNFSVEMETGTGKTYVYLRTIFELNKTYGFKKYVVVVPSIAIREGVLKNLEITKEHFKHIYNNVSYDYFVYDSKKINQVRQFAASNEIQIMIINIDSFRKTLEDIEDKKKSNVIHRESDKLSGRKPIEYIQSTKPIVIIDEPQSVDNTPKSKEAINTLSPLFILRYSATHRNPYNLMYKLDPVTAYNLRLVKRIEVASVLSDEYFNAAFIKFLEVDNTNGIKAKVSIHVESQSGPIIKNIWVKQGDDLFTKSNERECYKNGFILNEISAEPGNEFISFNNGRLLNLGESQGGLTDDILRVQIRNTIQEHLEKELKVKDIGLKVLSLFFIDRVANYRYYDDQGLPKRGKISLWFEQFYNELIHKPRYKELSLVEFPIEKIHDGYFSTDKKGILKDTSGYTAADEDVYTKIMKNKEQLLSFDEPLRFIFSHSALREGWDNPNVFQICTLNETKSEIKKRQEIGRGMRLPVNQNGERIFDENINKLTVIANESYEDFAKKLQTEIEEDFNIKFGIINKLAFSKITSIVDGQEKQLGEEKSKEIWNDLKENGYIDDLGKIQNKFDPKKPGFKIELNAELISLEPQIVDIVLNHQFTEHIVNKNDRKVLNLNKQIYLDEDFKVLWDKIKQKTTYSVVYDSALLIQRISSAIANMDRIEKAKIIYRKAGFEIKEKGIEATELRVSQTEADYDVEKTIVPDILTYLQNKTDLTRATIAKILISCGRLDEFLINPQKFMDIVTTIIKKQMYRLIIEGIKYEKIINEEYEMRRFEEEEIIRYLNNLIKVKKSVYDAIEYDSEIEKRFAEELDIREDIRLFVKLPDWFKVETPLGGYNPDWAIVKQNDETLYLVRETKGVKDSYKLRNEEADKLKCAKRHFQELNVDFKVVVEAREV